ncbi:MAG: hypothetical protein IPJ69_11220 [Deltaproteobacteria bacterium]|nr:MAG: hypothetical protein IPJ69_11220 [Deltaproteobacteria bacterium]
MKPVLLMAFLLFPVSLMAQTVNFTVASIPPERGRVYFSEDRKHVFCVKDISSGHASFNPTPSATPSKTSTSPTTISTVIGNYSPEPLTSVNCETGTTISKKVIGNYSGHDYECTDFSYVYVTTTSGGTVLPLPDSIGSLIDTSLGGRSPGLISLPSGGSYLVGWSADSTGRYITYGTPYRMTSSVIRPHFTGQ